MDEGSAVQDKIWLDQIPLHSMARVAEEPVLQSLRPQNFSEYIGQERVKEALLMACRAAKRRNEPLDHLLFHGPPGLGKTSLARLVAAELGVPFRMTSGPAIERPGDLAAILTTLERGEVLFIDEIHRLSRVVEEVLYPAMEDYVIDIVLGQGPAARSVRLDLKPFTLVGATTRAGLLTSPLRDRFGIVERLEFYSPRDLSTILSHSARKLNLNLDPDAALALGARSRGTPRIANRILKRVRDFAEEQEADSVSQRVVQGALALLMIDQRGLDEMDRTVLRTIIEKFDGGPVGVETLAAAIGEDAQTIEDVYEPYLLQEGFLARTRRGREATRGAYEHLGLPPKVLQPAQESTEDEGGCEI